MQNTATLQDVFTSKGLGPVAGRVWEFLHTGTENSGEAIARALGLSGGSVRRALGRLLDRGLVKRGGDGYYYAEAQTATQLERLSAALGTLGNSDKRKRGHARERETRLNKRLAQKRAESWRALEAARAARGQ